MREAGRYVDVRPYLRHALIATAGVLGLPLVALVVLFALRPAPGILPILVTVIAGAAIAAGIGMAAWKNRPESADIAFGELLIWGWLQRKHAEERLDQGVRLLGLDRSGHPAETVRIAPEQQMAVLQDLNDALEAKDPYTRGHSQRVERHAYRTAAAMGLSVQEIEELRLAAALHDVGKIRIPDRVLRKPSELTDEERSIVEDHVVVGAWMVSSVGTADVIGAVRHHHERWDGMGYPDGLAGSDIPLFARIIAVADAYDAITSTRPYRVSAGREHAIAVLKTESGAQFDPLIVDAFVDALPVRLPVAGAVVLLAGPAALARRLTMWLKRVGAGHLAPTAAALGAIVTLGAFLPVQPTLPRPPQAVAQEAADEAASQPATPRTAPQRLEARSGSDRPAPEEDVVLAARVSRPASRDGAAAPAPDTTTEHAAEPAPERARPEPEPQPEPKPQPKPEPKPDPKPAEDEVDGGDDREADERRCGRGPRGRGEEASSKGRSRAGEASDGRGPRHCP